MFVRIWAAVTVVVGLAVVAVTFFFGQEVGNWADDYAGTKAEYAFPAVTPLFVIALLGLVLALGGLVAALIRPKPGAPEPLGRQ